HKNEPLAGLIDHPALDVTTYAGAGLGIYCNGARLEQPCSGRQQKERNVRIATAKRENFMRWSDDSAVFDAIVRGYPSFWVFDNCYSHTAVLSGAADAMVDYNVRFWDVSPLKVLVEEAGGVFQCLRRAERTDGAVSYSVVFGVPEVVRELAAIYEEYMAKKRDT
ncbi:MAG TPA: inositol monophosphatase family protein, partial [Oligoflexia bacterium]|nr:inositol monophosphatase family protein [Oligoflexia bacterium]